MKILITGGTGFIGANLTKFFLLQGWQVFILTRNLVQKYSNLPTGITLQDKLVTDKDIYDVVINLAGEPLMGYWTKDKKATIYQSRINTTKLLLSFFEKSVYKPKVFLTGSAIGYYGHSQTVNFFEETPPQIIDFAAHLCADWEAAGSAAEALGIRVCYLRTGLVLDKYDGLLKKMLPTFSLGLGTQLGNGQQFMSWIALKDYINIIYQLIINTKISGPVNLTAPYPVSHYEFVKTLAKVVKKPCFFKAPDWLLKIILGEMAENILLQGQKVIPKKILQQGYEFQFPTLESALIDILS